MIRWLSRTRPFVASVLAALQLSAFGVAGDAQSESSLVAAPNPATVGATVSFTLTAPSSRAGYAVRFGDGAFLAIVPSRPVTHAYANVGTFDASVVADAAAGASAPIVARVPVRIVAAPDRMPRGSPAPVATPTATATSAPVDAPRSIATPTLAPIPPKRRLPIPTPAPSPLANATAVAEPLTRAATLAWRDGSRNIRTAAGDAAPVPVAVFEASAAPVPTIAWIVDDELFATQTIAHPSGGEQRIELDRPLPPLGTHRVAIALGRATSDAIAYTVASDSDGRTLYAGPLPNVTPPPPDLRTVVVEKIVLTEPAWGHFDDDGRARPAARDRGIPVVDDALRFAWREQNPGASDYFTLRIVGTSGKTRLERRVEGEHSYTPSATDVQIVRSAGTIDETKRSARRAHVRANASVETDGDVRWEIVGYRHVAGASHDVEIARSDAWPLALPLAAKGATFCSAGSADLQYNVVGSNATLTGAIDLADAPYRTEPNELLMPTSGGGAQTARVHFDNVFVDWGDGTVRALGGTPSSTEPGFRQRSDRIELGGDVSALSHHYTLASHRSARIFALPESDAQHFDPNAPQSELMAHAFGIPCGPKAPTPSASPAIDPTKKSTDAVAVVAVKLQNISPIPSNTNAICGGLQPVADVTFTGTGTIDMSWSVDEIQTQNVQFEVEGDVDTHGDNLPTKISIAAPVLPKPGPSFTLQAFAKSIAITTDPGAKNQLPGPGSAGTSNDSQASDTAHVTIGGQIHNCTLRFPTAKGTFTLTDVTTFSKNVDDLKTGIVSGRGNLRYGITTDGSFHPLFTSVTFKNWKISRKSYVQSNSIGDATAAQPTDPNSFTVQDGQFVANNASNPVKGYGLTVGVISVTGTASPVNGSVNLTLDSVPDVPILTTTAAIFTKSPSKTSSAGHGFVAIAPLAPDGSWSATIVKPNAHISLGDSGWSIADYDATVAFGKSGATKPGLSLDIRAVEPDPLMAELVVTKSLPFTASLSYDANGLSHFAVDIGAHTYKPTPGYGAIALASATFAVDGSTYTGSANFTSASIDAPTVAIDGPAQLTGPSGYVFVKQQIDRTFTSQQPGGVSGSMTLVNPRLASVTGPSGKATVTLLATMTALALDHGKDFSASLAAQPELALAFDGTGPIAYDGSYDATYAVSGFGDFAPTGLEAGTLPLIFGVAKFIALFAQAGDENDPLAHKTLRLMTFDKNARINLSSAIQPPLHIAYPEGTPIFSASAPGSSKAPASGDPPICIDASIALSLAGSAQVAGHILFADHYWLAAAGGDLGTAAPPLISGIMELQGVSGGVGYHVDDLKPALTKPTICDGTIVKNESNGVVFGLGVQVGAPSHLYAVNGTILVNGSSVTMEKAGAKFFARPSFYDFGPSPLSVSFVVSPEGFDGSMMGKWDLAGDSITAQVDQAGIYAHRGGNWGVDFNGNVKVVIVNGQGSLHLSKSGLAVAAESHAGGSGTISTPWPLPDCDYKVDFDLDVKAALSSAGQFDASTNVTVGAYACGIGATIGANIEIFAPNPLGAKLSIDLPVVGSISLSLSV